MLRFLCKKIIHYWGVKNDALFHCADLNLGINKYLPQPRMILLPMPLLPRSPHPSPPPSSTLTEPSAFIQAAPAFQTPPKYFCLLPRKLRQRQVSLTWPTLAWQMAIEDFQIKITTFLPTESSACPSLRTNRCQLRFDSKGPSMIILQNPMTVATKTITAKTQARQMTR